MHVCVFCLLFSLVSNNDVDVANMAEMEVLLQRSRVGTVISRCVSMIILARRKSGSKTFQCSQYCEVAA